MSSSTSLLRPCRGTEHTRNLPTCRYSRTQDGGDSTYLDAKQNPLRFHAEKKVRTLMCLSTCECWITPLLLCFYQSNGRISGRVTSRSSWLAERAVSLAWLSASSPKFFPFCILASWLPAHRRRCCRDPLSQRNGKVKSKKFAFSEVSSRPLFELHYRVWCHSQDREFTTALLYSEEYLFHRFVPVLRYRSSPLHCPDINHDVVQHALFISLGFRYYRTNNLHRLPQPLVG